MADDPLAEFRRERWQQSGMDTPEVHARVPVMSEHEALKRAIEALNQVPNHRLRNDAYTNTYKLIPDLEKAYQAGAERTKLEELAPRMYKTLLLCEDVLSDLARLDDGTPSISALTDIRAIQKEAGNLSEEQVIKLTQGIPVQVPTPGTEAKSEATAKLLETLAGIVNEFGPYVYSESDVEIKKRGIAWLKQARSVITDVQPGHQPERELSTPEPEQDIEPER